MFSIMENIYNGFQYILHIFATLGANLDHVFSIIPKMMYYTNNLLSHLSLPVWIFSLFLAIFNFRLLRHITHWGD